VFMIAIVVAVIFQHSFPAIILSPLLVWWGLVYSIQAISYTWLLKHVEMTAASVTFALLPLIFLPIDIFVRHEAITTLQIFGIFVLVAGGIIFFARKHQNTKLSLKRYALMMLGVLVFDAVVFGSEGYIFKSVYAENSLAPTSFLVSGMLYMCLFLTLMLLGRMLWVGRGGLRLTGAWKYARGSSVAKLADYGNIFFSLQALTIASVSQVYAMKVLHPLILLVIALVAQERLKLELEEMFTRDTIVKKVAGIALVVVGSFMIR